MSNSPHPGGPPGEVKRDEPNRDGGARQGNRGDDRTHGDLHGPGNFADDPAVAPEDLTRGAPPKYKKKYSHAG